MTKFQTYYTFDQSTGEHTGEMQVHPRQKSGSPNSTITAPPKTKANEIPVWDGKKWSLSADYRGTEYYLPGNDEKKTIKKIGETIPENALDEQPDTRTSEEIIADSKELVRKEIDKLSSTLTAQYTNTEEKGWLSMLGQAKAFIQSGKPEDAPGLALDAAIRGDTLVDRASSINSAAQVTGLIPSLASGIRARAEKLIQDTDGDLVKIALVMEKLTSKGQAILVAASQGDRDQIIALATTGWDD